MKPHHMNKDLIHFLKISPFWTFIFFLTWLRHCARCIGTFDVLQGSQSIIGSFFGLQELIFLWLYVCVYVFMEGQVSVANPFFNIPYASLMSFLGCHRKLVLLLVCAFSLSLRDPYIGRFIVPQKKLSYTFWIAFIQLCMVHWLVVAWCFMRAWNGIL